MAQFYADRVAIGSHRARTPEGYLLCLGIPFARTGFQVYSEAEIVNGGDPRKKVKVLRPYDEVLNPSTIASFEGKGITSPHPPQFLNPDNHQNYAKGHMQNVRAGDKLPDGEYSLLTDLLITDGSLSDSIEANIIKELSAGYSCEYEPDPHSPDIYRQIKIRGNHVAVVQAGRAGNSVKILDAKEDEVPEPAVTVAQDEKVSIGTLKAIYEWFGTLGRATDSESEAVERNKEKNEEALRRTKARNEDEAMENEKEAAEKKKAAEDLKKAVDAIPGLIASAVKDAMDQAMDKKNKDEEEKEKEKAKSEDEKEGKEGKEGKEEKEEKDSDLIPVATLAASERPKNPIPGADKALDNLRSIKAVVAATKDRKMIDSYNEAVRILKNQTEDGSGTEYADLAKGSVPKGLEMFGVRTEDAQKSNDDFFSKAKHFHRRNPKEAADELKASGKEK